MTTVIAPCPCVTGGDIRANCGVGSSTTANNPKPSMTQTYMNRNNGAAFQDERYGKGQRLHNVRSKDGKPCGMTCTVCGVRKGA